MSKPFEQAFAAFGFEDYTEKGREQLRDAIVAFLDAAKYEHLNGAALSWHETLRTLAQDKTTRPADNPAPDTPRRQEQ